MKGTYIERAQGLSLGIFRKWPNSRNETKGKTCIFFGPKWPKRADFAEVV